MHKITSEFAVPQTFALIDWGKKLRKEIQQKFSFICKLWLD